MDKRSILGFVLIAVILMAWLYWSNSLQNDKNPQNKVDTTSQVQQTPDTSKQQQPPADTTKNTSDTTSISDSSKQVTELVQEYGAILYSNSSKYAQQTGGTPEKIITIENSKVSMEFSNYGGTIRKFITKDFKTWKLLKVFKTSICKDTIKL